MTTVLQSVHTEPRSSLYARTLMSEFGDNRYPSLRPSSQGLNGRSWTNQPTMATTSSDSRPPTSDSIQMPSSLQLATGDRLWDSHLYAPSNRLPSPQDQRSPDNLAASYDSMRENQRNILSYNLPPGAAHRAAERYSLDDNNGLPPPSRTSNELTQTLAENQSIQETVTGRNRPRTPTSRNTITPQGRASPNPSLGRRSTLQPTPPPPPMPDGGQIPPIMPLSASPAYAPPVSPNHRAFAQQPTYVNQPNAGNPIQPVYTPIVPQQEEICIECAMRDQDMADVDVTSAGVWDRASDAVFEELKRREMEDEAAGIVSNDPQRPRIKGGRLTEQNVRVWLSVNPREPTSKQQTLRTYVKSQRILVEAEAQAHFRRMQEVRQVDSRTRDAYSQLRRSVYDASSLTSPIDDVNGVRIRSPSMPPAARSHSREATLLENGMIVEQVNIRREEKEARERRKREEKRARKSSRGSGLEISSIISQGSGQFVDGGLKPSRASQAYSARPASIFTTSDRPDIPRAYSQLSFSDVNSLGSTSPRKRFFGIKNFNGGWRSQDSLAPSGVSGSMIDMHVALHRDGYRGNVFSPPIDLNTSSRSQVWPPADLDNVSISQLPVQDERAKKKVNAVVKMWRKVTGKSDGQQKDMSPNHGPHDDYPLTPPPPLTYLVEGKSQIDFNQNGGPRQGSTNSLPSSATSQKFFRGQLNPGMSPPTTASSVLPSPASLRHSGDIEVADGRQTLFSDSPIEDAGRQEENLGKPQNINWQPDLRQKGRNSTLPIGNGDAVNGSLRATTISLSRDKSLPPIPTDESPAQVLSPDRPKTFYALDSTPKQGSRDLAPPEAPFRNLEMRRQSFSGTSSSRPNIAFQTTTPIAHPADSTRSLGPRYDEFGISRRSLGRLDHIQENPWPRPPLPNTAPRRKSKFGLSSLLNKKSKREPEYDSNQLCPSLPYSAYDNQDDTMTGYATSTSRHSAISTTNTPNMRMSVYGRRPLEELVQQDPEFISYRYPSADQRLDLLRP